jgi:agmatinase
MTKQEKIDSFDPNGLAEDNGHLYGLPFDTSDADLIIIPVPWEVTVSYSGGTAAGPAAILEASKQVDLYDPYIKDAWKLGLSMDIISDEVSERSDWLRKVTEQYLDLYENGVVPNQHAEMSEMRRIINEGSAWLNNWVKDKALYWLAKGKKVALLGGDHSTPLGLIQALGERYKSFGILQIDAHADLRDAYEGFEFSHASIMFNAIKEPSVTHLVQVGIRDFCEAEAIIASDNPKVVTFYDHDIKNRQFDGHSWSTICDDIVSKLPDNVYLSFDIDGLDPKLCPNTGTPVPGGFEFEQILFLVRKVITSGRQIISFDINEVAPGIDGDEWDANVGARLLYRISNQAMAKFAQ